MATVTYLGNSYPCARALMGGDYIHLLDDSGTMVTAFDGVTDFSGFAIVDGAWETPVAEGDCHLAVIKEDGTIGKGTHRCCDITVPTQLTGGGSSVGAGGTIQIINGQKWTDWRLVMVNTSNGAVFVNPGSSTCTGGGIYVNGSGTLYTLGVRLTISGQTLTVNVATGLPHNASGNHGAAISITITSIFGLVKA